jgi:hypothetical protein
MKEDFKDLYKFGIGLSRSLLAFILISMAVGFCYRAGEVHLFDDKSVCKAVYTLMPMDAKPVVVKEVPFGGAE